MNPRATLSRVSRAFTQVFPTGSLSPPAISRCPRCLRLQLRRPNPRSHGGLPLPTRRFYASPADREGFKSALDAPPQLVRQGRRHGWGLIVLAIIPLTSLALGTWQIQRLRWKTSLMARLEDNLARPPLPLPPRVDPDAVAADFDHRRVTTRGRFDHAREMLVGPRPRDGEDGFVVVTPLVRAGVPQRGIEWDEAEAEPQRGGDEAGISWWETLTSWLRPGAAGGTLTAPDTGGATDLTTADPAADTILVTRGWIPRRLREHDLRPAGLPSGIVTVEGLLRRPFRKNMFTPANRPEIGGWYFPDVAEMAAWAGTAPVWVEATMEPSTIESAARAEAGVPIGRPAEVALRNNHVQYIVTWYALAAATSVMFWILVRRPPTEIARRVRRSAEW